LKGIPEQSNDTVRQPQPDEFPYLETCRLSSPPFSSTIDPSSAFVDETWQQNLDQLTHLIQSSDLLLAVSAEDGMGKSTLSQLFIMQADEHLRCCPITVTGQLDKHGLLEKLSNCFNLPTHLDDQALMDLLQEQGNDLQRNDIIPVILLDDAQHLSDETLQLLLQLGSTTNHGPHDKPSAWRILLFTTPSLTTKLIQLQSHLHVIQLVPMDKHTIEHYLLHRLKQVGLKQPSPFSDKDINFIYQHTYGNINQINLLAHQVLLKKSTRTNKPMKTKSQDKTPLASKPMVWVALAIVILLSIVLFFQNKINQLVEPETDNESILAQSSFDLPATKEYLLKKIPDSPPPATVELDRKEDTPAEDHTPSTTSEVTTTIAEEKPEPVQPVEIISEPEPQKAPPIPAKPPAKNPARNNTGAMASLEGLLDKNKIKDKAWILEQPAAFMTAQMMASSKPDALIRQAKNPAVQGQVAIYHILRNNKDWYVMIYGSYKDKSSMRKAVDKLPATLKKGKPWLRSMSAIQAEIMSGKK